MSWVKEEFGNMLIVLFSWQIFHVEQEQGCLFRFLFFFFWFPTECLSPRWKSVVIRQLQVLLSTRNTWLRERLTTLTINSQGSPKHLDRDGISIINVGGSGTSFLYITVDCFQHRVISTSFYPSSLEKHWNMYRKTVPWNSRVFNETKGATA